MAKYDEYLRLQKEIRQRGALVRGDDANSRQLAREELLRPAPRPRPSSEIMEMMLVEDKDASKNVIMEVRAGVGGLEAALFAGDLFRMYSKYAERGWKMESSICPHPIWVATRRSSSA